MRPLRAAIAIALIASPAAAETNCQNMGAVAGMFAQALTKCRLPARAAISLAYHAMLNHCEHEGVPPAGLGAIVRRGANTFDAAAGQIEMVKACSNTSRLMCSVEDNAKK